MLLFPSTKTNTSRFEDVLTVFQ